NKLEYQQAVKIYEGISGHVPLEGPAAEEVKQAETMVNQGKYGEALDAYRRASQVEPDNVNVLMPYALLCSHLDMNGEAIAAARRVLKEKPTEVVAAAAYTTLVEALRAEGNFKEANRALEDMLHEYTSNYAKSIAYYERAYNLAEMEENLDEALESGQKDRARAVFRRAKSFKAKGAGLEEKILEQIRSTTKLIDRLHAKRRRTQKTG